MTYSQISHFAQGILKDTFLEFGYEIKDKTTFIRNDKDGFNEIEIVTMKGQDGDWSKYSTRLGCDRQVTILRNIYLKICERYPKKYQVNPANVCNLMYCGIPTTKDEVDYKEHKVIWTDDFNTLEEAEVCLEKLRLHLIEDALPTMDKLLDLRYIDNLANGENYWIYKYFMKKHIYFVNNMFTRLSIAYLCQNPRFEQIYQTDLQEYKKMFRAYRPDFDDYHVDGKNPIEYLYEILHEMKPLQFE